MSDEYNLTEAGAFTENDLLEFRNAEFEKSKTVRKIWITQHQANHLANSIEGNKPIKTGNKLIDFWNAPNYRNRLKTVHGIEIGIEK